MLKVDQNMYKLSNKTLFYFDAMLTEETVTVFVLVMT